MSEPDSSSKGPSSKGSSSKGSPDSSNSSNPSNSDVAATIVDLFHRRGGSRYGGEDVTQLEHALQAAMFAERAGAEACLVTAALLHDLGHLLHDLPDDAPDSHIDDRHEVLAADWLQSYFDDTVVQPVRLHVAAKRHLCAADPAYLKQLSPPSILSLQLQGGPMTPDETDQFERHPQFEPALRVRRWDEAAKAVGMKTPGVEHFVVYVQRAARE